MATMLKATITVYAGKDRELSRTFAAGPVDPDTLIAPGLTLRQAVRADLLVDEAAPVAPNLHEPEPAPAPGHEE